MRKMKKTIFSLENIPQIYVLPPISRENLVKSHFRPQFSVMEDPMGYFSLHFPCNLGIWSHSPVFLVNFMRYLL